MNNLKIGVRLAIGFGAMILMMVTIGAIGMNRLEASVRALQDASGSRHPLLTMAGQLNANAALSADRLRDLLLARSPAESDARRQRLRDLRSSDEQLFSLLQKSVAGAHAGNEATLAAARLEYVQAREHLLTICDKGGREAAIELWFSEMLPALDRYSAELGKLIADEKARADTGTRANIAAVHSATSAMAALLMLAVVMASAAAFFINRSITVPIKRAVDLAEAVAHGDLTPALDRDGATRNEAGRMLFALGRMTDHLREIVAEVHAGAGAIAAASAEIAGGSMNLSARTEQQASSLEQTSSSMEELTDAVKQNAVNARAASKLAVSASSIAKEGGSVIDQMIATMTAIDKSSRRIVEIIGVIDSIAFQTNILALNAAVEAARAGEQGRGFAIVATEVRNLARRSGAAAKEIKALIADSTAAVDSGNRLVVKAGSTMSQIMTSAGDVVDIMNEISAASEEQAQGIDQICQAIAQMDKFTQQNAALVEQTAAAAQSMEDQGQALKRAVGAFTRGSTSPDGPSMHAAVR